MERLNLCESISLKGEYDIIVAGGGVAGVAAAVSAKRMGKSVLLIEKTVALGGLATNGIINLFVPMCNGRGVQIIKGMAEELFRISIKYGYDTIPEQWRDGQPSSDVTSRYITRFSPGIFSLALTEMVVDEGVNILYDTVVAQPVMKGKHCDGVVVENKSGREYYKAKIVIDTTGDADILYQANVPTKQGENFFTMVSLLANMDSVKTTAEKNDIRYLTTHIHGGKASLYGANHPDGMPFFHGTSGDDVTDYVVKNHLETLKKLKDTPKNQRDIVMLPAMAQFRTTRTLVGDSIFSKDDEYKHCDTSIGAICDFERRDYLFEIPYGTLVKTGFDNLITAGRSAAAKLDYSWDILRVIPPAIITGQAAGIAASIAIDSNKPIYNIDVHKLQAVLEEQNVIIHFDDTLIPTEKTVDIPNDDIGHI